METGEMTSSSHDSKIRDLNCPSGPEENVFSASDLAVALELAPGSPQALPGHEPPGRDVGRGR